MTCLIKLTVFSDNLSKPAVMIHSCNKLTSGTRVCIAIYFLYIFSRTRRSTVLLVCYDSSRLQLFSCSASLAACTRHAPVTPYTIDLTFENQKYNCFITCLITLMILSDNLLKAATIIHSCHKFTSGTCVCIAINFLYIFSGTRRSTILLVCFDSSRLQLFSCSTSLTACTRHAPVTPHTIDLMFEK